MELVNESKVFLNPGSLVTLRQDIPNKPVMLVVRKETSMFKHDDKRILDKKPILLGIRCRWFTNTGEMLEAVFSTKDLILVEDINQ